MSIAERDVEIAEILRAQDAMGVILARHVKLLAGKGGHEELGYPSPTAYLKHRGRMSGGHAQQVVTRANAEVKGTRRLRRLG